MDLGGLRTKWFVRTRVQNSAYIPRWGVSPHPARPLGARHRRGGCIIYAAKSPHFSVLCPHFLDIFRNADFGGKG